MTFTIRRYEAADAGAVADVFFRSVREVAASDYDEAQRMAWMPELRSAGQIHGWAGDGRLVLVAVDDGDRVVAFTDLEADGHVGHLFCAPEAAGRRVAARLCDAVEAAARAQGGSSGRAIPCSSARTWWCGGCGSTTTGWPRS